MEPTRSGAADTTTWLITPGGEHAVLRSHAPAGTPGPTAVLMAPPFGWDDMCSYRPRRAVAGRLATAGILVARVELPGTGDAEGGPWDGDRLASWVGAVGAAAAQVRSQPGVERVAVFGIGLGGLLAWLAAAAGAPIDDLALWAVPADGNRLLRELKALSRLEVRLPGDDGLPAGALAAAGYVLSSQSVTALRAIDLAEVPLPGGPERRVLLFDRDGLAPALVEAATASGAAVEVAPGPGYGDMLREPQWAEEPVVVAERLAAWVAAAPGASPHAAPEPPAVRDVLALRDVHERLEVVHGPRGGLPSFVTEPAGGPTAPVRALLLNAGPQRHIGPNRMWVEAARRWAATRGVTTARVDLGGIGDAQTADVAYGDVGELYTDDYAVEAAAVIDALDDGRPVVVVGLCSGAYWGFHAALGDPRVAGIVLVNPRTLLWSQEQFDLKDARNLARQVRDPESWRKAVRGDVDGRRLVRLARAIPHYALRRLARRPGGALPTPSDPLGPLLDRLPARGTRLTLIFSGDEELVAELDALGHLVRLGAHPLVDVHRVGDPATDTHTLRPPALQREVGELLDAALDAVAARVSPNGGYATPRP